MLSFKEIEPALHKWAFYYQNRWFDHWELINAVWSKGDVQVLPHINLASNRIRWDMIEYMRGIHGGRVPRRQEFLRKTVSIYDEIGDNFELVEFIACKSYNTEVDDLFPWVLRGLDNTERMIIKLRYYEDFTLADIARVIGLTESAISLKLKSLLKRIKSKLKNTIYESRSTDRISQFKKTNRSLTKHKTNTAEYNRLYYQAHKEQISYRRKLKAG